MRVARRVLVSGRVQGVAFRWAARERALSLGVSGWIRNLRDGRVELWIEAEESDSALDEMLDWLTQGPPHARVDRREVDEVDAAVPSGFEIRRG